MNPFESSAWYRAMTLAERLHAPAPPIVGGNSASDPLPIERRYEEWRSQEPFLRASAEELAADVLDRVVNGNWRCGNPLLVESPGLMTGLAGIGYGLLRQAAPAEVPSVLRLAPPPTSLR